MPRYNQQQEARPSRRERKLSELASLAQLSGALDQSTNEQQSNATRQQQGRVAAALQLLGLQQQQQEAQQQQAFRQQQLDLQKQENDASMLARAGAQANEAAQFGVQNTQNQRMADINLLQTMQQNPNYTEPFLTEIASRISPDVVGGANAKITGERTQQAFNQWKAQYDVLPEGPMKQQFAASRPEFAAMLPAPIQGSTPKAVTPSPSAPNPMPPQRPPDPTREHDPRSGFLQIGPPMPDNPIGGTLGFFDALMKGNITAANAHLARKYISNAPDSRLSDWLKLTYNLQ